MANLFANSGNPDQSHVLRRLIWVCTVCQVLFYGSPDYNGLICCMLEANSQDEKLSDIFLSFLENGAGHFI